MLLSEPSWASGLRGVGCMCCNLVAKHRQLKTETLCLTPGITTLLSFCFFEADSQGSIDLGLNSWWNKISIGFSIILSIWKIVLGFLLQYFTPTIYTANEHVALLCVVLESHHHKPLWYDRDSLTNPLILATSSPPPFSPFLLLNHMYTTLWPTHWCYEHGEKKTKTKKQKGATHFCTELPLLCWVATVLEGLFGESPLFFDCIYHSRQTELALLCPRCAPLGPDGTLPLLRPSWNQTALLCHYGGCLLHLGAETSQGVV